MPAPYISTADLDNWFAFHPARPGSLAGEKHQAVRDAAREFAGTIMDITPPGPDQTTAIRTVREAMMWANAAIACGGEDA